MKKHEKSPVASSETTSEIAESIFREALEHVRKEIRGLIEGRLKPKGHDPASRVAWLAQRAAAVAAEARKAEKGEVGKLTHAAVLAWVKVQPAEYRARLVREVSALDAKGGRSVLA